jgi:hypothetical protein
MNTATMASASALAAPAPAQSRDADVLEPPIPRRAYQYASPERANAPACAPMCQPSAVRASDPDKPPMTISVTMVARVNTATRRVRICRLRS